MSNILCIFFLPCDMKKERHPEKLYLNEKLNQVALGFLGFTSLLAESLYIKNKKTISSGWVENYTFHSIWRSPVRLFIIVFTNVRHWNLSWARLIESTPSYPTLWRFNPITVLPYTSRYSKWFLSFRFLYFPFPFHAWYIILPPQPHYDILKWKLL